MSRIVMVELRVADGEGWKHEASRYCMAHEDGRVLVPEMQETNGKVYRAAMALWEAMDGEREDFETLRVKRNRGG